MSEPKAAAKAGRPSRSLQEEIAAAEERLRNLRTKQKEEDRKERERNQKAILALIRSEGLDAVSPERWKAVLPKLRKLLGAENKPDTEAGAATAFLETAESATAES